MARVKSFKDAVKYVCKTKFGYITALQEEVGVSNVELLKNTGFLSCGRNFSEGMQNTWKVTNMAKTYCKAMYGGVFVRM